MIEFGTVDRRAAAIAVIGEAGAALVSHDAIDKAIEAGVRILALNGAIDALPACTDWLCINPVAANRARMVRRPEGVTLYAGVPEDYGERTCRVPDYRAPVETGVVYLARSIDAAPPKAHGTIRTIDIGVAGLDLAAHMKPKRIALIGLGLGDPLKNAAIALSRSKISIVFCGSGIASDAKVTAMGGNAALDWLIGKTNKAANCFSNMEKIDVPHA